jgi:hypothetical protein
VCVSVCDQGVHVCKCVYVCELVSAFSKRMLELKTNTQL